MVRRGPLRAGACSSCARLGMRYCDRCYVEGGTQCATAIPSLKHPGAATKECDVCTCTQTGISNGFGQANVGCGNHLQDGDFFCYTAVRFPSFATRRYAFHLLLHGGTLSIFCYTAVRFLTFGTLFRSPPPLRAGRQQMPRCDAERLGWQASLRPVRLHRRLAERKGEGAVQRLCEPC